MKTYKLIVIACCVLLGHTSFLRAQAEEEFEELDGEYCVYIPSGGTTSFGKSTPSSTFGKDFTPKGDLKALVVFVDFVGSDSGPDGNGGLHPLNRWPAGELPNHILINNSLAFAHDQVSEFSPIGNPDTNAFSNISEYYYHMSNGSFRFLMEPLKDDNGNAVLIRVDASGVGSFAGQNGINALVFQEIATLFPNRDWASLGFDIRGDDPSFDEDQSATFANPEPDGQLDFTILVYRNRSNWNPHPVIPMGPTPRAQGVASIYGPHSLNTSNSFTANRGFTFLQASTNRASSVALYLHELGHNFIDLPHTSLANEVHGKYFHATNSWGMMNFARAPSISNAWERWYNGWIDIEHELSDAADNGTYVLNDYMSSGDAMRLKLPYTDDQFLWLTNRSDATNPFYNRGFNGPIEVIDDVVISRINDTDPRGLFGFFERIAPDRSAVDRVVIGANGIKVFSGKGYYDLKTQSISPTSAIVAEVNLLKDQPNPYGEEGEYTAYRFNVNNNTRINYNDNFNDTDSGGPDSRNEFGRVIEIDNQRAFSRNLLNSELPDQKYSVFTNPPITNFLEYGISQDALSPVILHSLSFTSQTVGNQVNITVDYDDGHIEEDFRMTGNIFLPPNEDIVLNTNVTLRVNRSGTNNRRNQDATNGSFINETVLIATANSSFESSNDSTIILDEASTTIFEEDSELIMGSDARIIIRGGALLCIKTTDVTLDPTARIIVEDGFLNISSGIDISANVEGSIFPFPTIANTITFCNNSITGPIHLHSLIETNTGNIFCGNDVTVNVNDDVRLTSEQLIVIEPGFEAVPGSFFEAEIRTEIPQDCDIEFFFGTNGEPEFNGFTGGRRDFNNLQNGKSLAISVYPNPSKDIFNVEITDAKGPFTYQLKNLSGVTLLEDQTSNTNFRIDAKHLKKGVYVLMVSNNTLSTGYKIIKF